MLLLAVGVRFGEALHPGPQEGGPGVWTLGIANPSGLNGKLDQINNLSGDAWLLTETHLSPKGVSSFTKGLKMLRSPWKYVVAGSPCDSRKRTDTGVHAGVLFLSKFPARAIPHAFSDDVYTSARVQVVGMAVADTWVTVGLLYGLPCHAHHKQARFQTDVLLSELVDRVACQATGPRAIGGDFNYGPDELEQLHRLRALGFREIQDLRALRFGVSAEPTGRGSRRLDQLWISPELQHAYKATMVEFDHWADHAAVSATFGHDDLRATVTSWHRPAPFPWPSEWTCPVTVDFADDLTVAYAHFWSQVEGHANCWVQHQGAQVTKAQVGRASVLEATTSKVYLCPTKKARKGEVQPGFMGVSVQHARIFRQLRWLQNLCRILQKPSLTWNSRLNRDETWRAIRCAVGFPGGFGVWCQRNGLFGWWSPCVASLLP